jgi:hypothetical protein
MHGTTDRRKNNYEFNSVILLQLPAFRKVKQDLNQSSDTPQIPHKCNLANKIL